MDLLSLYYFSELAKDLHITRTANRLFITQQTLSSRIQRLEAYYGTRLLDRKPALSLTLAGEQVLAFARRVLKEEDDLKNILLDIGQEERGVIKFGASVLRMNHSIPHILPAFTARYPQVELYLTSHNSAKLEGMVMEGELDFALILAQSGERYTENPGLACRHLIDDQIYLCASDTLLNRHGVTEAQKKQAQRAAAVEDFPQLPYCIYENSIGRQVQACFEDAGIEPKRLLTDNSATFVSVQACFQGLAASFLSRTHLVDIRSQLPEDVCVFPLCRRGVPVTQSLYLIWGKDRYLPRFAKDFISMIAGQFAKVGEAEL